MQHPTKISCKVLDGLNVHSQLCSNVAQLLNFVKHSSVVVTSFRVLRKIFCFEFGILKSTADVLVNLFAWLCHDPAW